MSLIDKITNWLSNYDLPILMGFIFFGWLILIFAIIIFVIVVI